MSKKTAFVVIVGFVLVVLTALGAYAAWYSYDRQAKIAHNIGCDSVLSKPAPSENGVSTLSSCAYEIVPPTLWEKLTGQRPEAQQTYLISEGCDQSATTTDCSKIPRTTEERGYFFPATFYTEFASTTQSGKIDEHLFVGNTLIEVTFCGKIYRTRQIFIDGADVVSRLAALANAGVLPKDEHGRVGLCQSLPGEIHLRGIIGTEDVKSFDGSDVGLPGTTYLVVVAANAFDINPQTGNIYQVGGYDGSLSGSIGTLWATYTNDELSVSFMYPPNAKADASQWGIGKGDTGRAFQATIGLPSGAVIYAYATTKDYSTGKSGFSVGTEGFVVKDGEYHTVSRGDPINTTFIPDEVWRLGDGSSVPVIYGKNYDPSLDYPDAAAKAMVNIPNATFTGIGFVLWNMNNTGSHLASAEDLVIFKKIITSVKFVK